MTKHVQVEYEEIEEVADEWHALSEALGTSPFLQPGWFSAWREAFGADQLAVLVARRDGRLTGALPVVRSRRMVRSATNWHTPEYGAVAEDEETRDALFEGVFADRPRRVDLSFLSSDSRDGEALERAAESYSVGSEVMLRSPYLQMNRSWESYWGERSGKLRGEVRRCRRRLEERGELAVEISDGEKPLDPLLEEGFQLEASGWKGEKGTAIISSPHTNRFYREICDWAADAGLLRLSCLRLDGVAVAFQLNFQVDRRYFGLKMGHDAALQSFSPGTVLFVETFSRCFEQGMDTFELLGDADRHKLRWGDDCRERLRIQAFSQSPAGAVDRLVQTRGRSTAKRLLRRRR
jgi:CelD/BcsL family acetyltransferase involved in cellulose biosynthesis